VEAEGAGEGVDEDEGCAHGSGDNICEVEFEEPCISNDWLFVDISN